MLIRVTAPTVVIGLLLFGTCLVSAWHINRLQTDMATILLQNVTSLEAAQELEITLRKLRFRCILYLLEPQPERLDFIVHEEEAFRKTLRQIRESAMTPAEQDCLQRIEGGYEQYRKELARMWADAPHARSSTRIKWLADREPVRHVVDPCEELLQLNKGMMTRTSEDSASVSRKLQWAMLLLGLGGPISGIIMGYGMARGLSRSIYQLSVRVQDMAQCLDQDVASVSVTGDGDIHHLDQRMQHIVRRVQEVAERMQRHQCEMLRAQQLSAVGQLAASVAHEVRNPLTAIKMLVEAALRTHRPKPLTVDDLHVIHGEVVQLEQRVQDFLDFARLPTPRRSACDLRDVIAQAVELVRVRARQESVDIAVYGPDWPVPANVDRGQLCTVLVNLFINALDAMPQGGRLGVCLEADGEDQIHLCVTDTGKGIAAEMADRLFVPFSSTKATGTGLGLSISHRIVQEHGGRITAGNRPEGGACFTITLPIMPLEGNHAHAVGH
jgi:signal transduction histidine kinase